MDIRDLAYEPEVTVEQVYQVTCDGGCEWETVSPDARRADSYAAQHRAWHKKIIDVAESDLGPCSSCGAQSRGQHLRAARHEGGLPYLTCRDCGADW